MAITTETVVSTSVIQIGDDDDDYADLLTHKGANSGDYNADTDMPQVTRPSKPIYLPTGIEAEFVNPFLVLDPGSGIAVQTIGDGRLRITDGTIIVNTDTANKPAGVHNQRTAQFHQNNTNWNSIEKNELAPIELRNSTLIFTSSEFGNNNALVLSYSVGDGLGACKIIWDRALTSTGDRLFIGASYNIVFTDIFVGNNKLVFNHLLHNEGAIAFRDVRIYGEEAQIDNQGLTIYEGTRFPDNTRETELITAFYGNNSPRNRTRVTRCFVNMTYLLDDGVGGTDTSFPLIHKIQLDDSSINGSYMAFVNRWRLLVTDTDDDPLEGVSAVGFQHKSSQTADILCTALDFAPRMLAYAYDSDVYGVTSDALRVAAGDTIMTRLDANNSLEGASEYLTDSNGRPVISGQTAESFLDFPSVYAISNGTTTTLDRENFENPTLRLSLYGYLLDEVELALGADPDDDGSAIAMTRKLSADDGITESDYATVNDATTVSNLDELYDKIRAEEYRQRDNPNMRSITRDGNTITLPSNSTVSETTDATSVTYAAGSTTYLINNDDTDIVTGDTFGGVSAGSDGTINTGIFASGVILTDQSGVTLLVRTTPVSSEIRIEEYDAAGTTLQDPVHTGTSDSTGVFTTTVAGDAQVRIYTKKWGYEFDRTNHDMADGLEVDVSMVIIPHVDATRDITTGGYVNTPPVTGANPVAAPIDKNLYFEFDDTDGSEQGNWVCGEINLTNKFILSAAILDNRISSQDGLTFFAWFNEEDGIDDHLQGRPFVWSHDRLEVNEDHMQFLRVDDMTGTQISRVGSNVKNKDGETNYTAPASNNSRVQFDNLAVLVPRSTIDDISVQTRDDLERDDGLLSEVHTKTEQMNFVGDDLKATLDGESVHVQDEHYYVPDTDDDKVYVYNRNKIRNESLEWNFHTDHSSVVSLVWYDELWYAIHSPSGGTVSVGVYTPHGDRQTGLEFDLPSDIVWVQAAFILNGVLHVLTNTGSARKIHKVSLATHLEITPSIDLSAHTEIVHGMDYYDGFVYVTDSRDDINDPQRVVVFAIDGTHDSDKSFNLVLAQENPTGVTVTATRIIVIDAASEPPRIFRYDHTGAHQSGENIKLVTENAHPGGISLIKTTVSDLTRVARDVKTTLDYSLADITITDETVTFDDEFGNTIATFSRKTGDVVGTYWGRGRERA